MNLHDFIALRAYYKARLAIATSENYLQVLQNILNDIELKVKKGLLTNKQGDELVRALLGVALESYRSQGLESLSESIEKGAIEISFDANDSIASMVAALRSPKS